MEFKLDVLISTSIKQRKPWPRISWIGQEKEAVFLLDDKRINEINLVSGKTKKKIPHLQSLLKNVVVLTTSRNGAWLAGILTTGDLFLWNKDQDCLKIVPAIEESRKVVASAQECLMRLYLYVSGDGRKALLTTPTACTFLWEGPEHENTSSCKNSSPGHWTQILPDESVMLPSTEEKEIGVHAAFIQNEILGDSCLCSFVFYAGEHLVLTFSIIRWHENSFKYVSSLPYQVHWVQQTCSLLNLVPQCVSVKSRGALLCAFARDGLLLAVAVNQTDPKATQILFLNTLNFVTVSGSLKGCSSKNSTVPSKFIRSYWVGDMSWTSDSLFLACMLKRGSLILLTCMGELLTLITSGCSVEFGPAEFIPFHPLITYRQQHSFYQDPSQSLGSSASESDLMRQRFSVASHSRLPYLIVSDGYMITVLRFPNNLSPSGFIRTLLLDSTQRLESIRRNLLNSKSKERLLCLRSLLSLKAGLLKHAQNRSSIFSTIPKFLEEDSAEIREKTVDLLDYEEESDDQNQFGNSSSSFYSQRIHSFVSKADQGHLEFASMFDTIHAEDNTEDKDKLSVELYSVQKNLLAAWQIGISKDVEEKDKMLNYTVNCVIHFFSILQFVKCSLLNQDASLNKSAENTHWIHCVLKYFQQFLTILCWHSRASPTGHVAKLTLQTLKLMLIQQQDQLFSKNLLACFCLLKMVSHTLSNVCILQYENFFSSTCGNNLIELDSLTVPVFLVLDESTTQQFSSLKSLLAEPPRAVNHDAKTEKRLIVLWRLLYKKVVWYQVQLKRKVNKNVEEESVASSLLSHIQATLQSSGVTLEQHLKINSVAGEEKFLLGSYTESLDIWKRSLCEIKGKEGKRICFLQSRYYLAILFCHLYQYNLCEAQGLCDHLVGEILRRSQLTVGQTEKFSDTKYFQHELWMVTDVHTETAMAVIRSMARFMAAYFTNQLLYIFPPHNVDILHPLHIKQDVSPRIIPLQHCLVTRAVREQKLSSVWTAEYALDLFFVGGLIPEAVWLTHRLGDWKLSVSIGVAYQLYCQNSEFSRLKNTECHLPLSLSPVQTFQEKLQSLLGQPVTSETSGCLKYKRFTDPLEEEDADILYSSIQELLKAAAMADTDILSETFQLLMDSAKELSRKLYGLVPDGLYLPAPPLYCPQPASLSEEDCNDILLKIERESRQKVSGILQRIILLFRAAHCSCPAAQWYITKLKWARKVMRKIQTKGSLPSLSPFPETLLRYSNVHTVFCRSATSGDHRFDDITCKILGWFRELCALCWMFHVRERLSDNCRRYQTARENINNHKDLKRNEYDASTIEHCLNAVEWACRLLPFCRFMNAEELVQDVILSLLGELPPAKKVAEIFVKAFPNPEDIRVPLRDKYHGLQQRLRHSVVKGSESEEIMSIVIQATEKVRMKALRHVIKNIGPVEIHIWEPAEEGAASDEHCYDRFSLGTSLSRSTLTDLGNSQVYSDADTADTLSDALFAEEMRAQTPSLQRDNEHQRLGEIGSKNTTCKIKACNWKTKPKDKVCGEDTHDQCVMPVVGAWEFERDDDEYVIFLEVFLSYILERDLVNYSDLGIPFLTSFSGLLRDHELNSLFFDVHTTLKRRQGKARSQSVFRAGSCYTVALASCDPETASVCNENQNNFENQAILRSALQITEPSVCTPMKGFNDGLFGLKHKSIYRAQSDNQEVTVASANQTFHSHTFSSLQTQATSKYVHKTVGMVDIVPGEELPVELMGKLSNIAKLLEWMVRWSDKRLLCSSNKQDFLQEVLPMIHVKTSAAAVLTSLWLLEQLYGDGSQQKSIKFKNPDNQNLKEFASLSEAQSRTEKEGSMDEGSSILGSPSVDVQSVQAYDDLCETSSGMSAKSKYFNKKELKHGNYSVPHVTEDHNEVGPFVQKIDVTSDIEFFEEPYETPKSSNSSVKIKPIEHQRGKASYCLLRGVSDYYECSFQNTRNSSIQQVSFSDVDSPQEDQNVAKTTEGKAEENAMTEVVTGTISHLFSLEEDAEGPSNTDISVSDDQPSQTVVSTMSSVASATSICAKKQEAKEEVPTEEKLNTSGTVRQTLQDEMFKLVQLQQINFLSLMQIVQSSFASLPNVQQILQRHQSVHLEGGQPAHTAESSASLKTQVPTEEDKRKPGQKSSDFQLRNSLSDESNNGYIKAPKLIPVQDLIAFGQCHQHDTVPSTSFGQDRNEPIQLLKTDVEPFELRMQNNRKRQKRRDKIQMKEKEEKKKQSVSFRPDDSIISISDAVMAVESGTEDQEAKFTSYLQDAFFVSMGKKAAETRDASTSTHPVLKSYQDVGVSTGNEISASQNNESVMSFPVSEVSSVPEIQAQDMYLNQRFPTEVNETPLPSFLSDAPDLIEHEYISVVDIEDSDILNNLPVIPEAAEETATAQQNDKLEIPCTAKLNHMTASVTSAVPPQVLQKKDNHLKNLSSQVQKEDRPDSAIDGVTWNTLHGRAPSSGLPSKVTGKEYFSTKQQEMDMQLQRLQNITENMEEDFRNTKQLVKMIENVEMAANSDLGAHPLFSEDARINKDGKDLCDSPLEDPLQITGLSGVTDIITDLVVKGDVSPLELGFTKLQAEKISRVHDSAAGHSRRTEKEKKEIQAWMKRKQKERMREYVKKLDEQRQKEHNPFSPRKNGHCSLTSKDIKCLQKMKEEKHKALLTEHHNVRISQALSLMNEMLSETVVLTANEHRTPSKTRSPQEYKKRCMASAKRGHPNSSVVSERSRIAAKSSFGQKVHCFTPSLGLTHSRGKAYTLLQKNASRGRMKTAANCPVNSRHSAEYRVSRTSKQKHPHLATAVQTEDIDQESDRDIVSPWTVPGDIQRILQDTHDSLFQASALHPVSFSHLGTVDTDDVSESTGSILSKLDWDAIEAMVADVEDK
ncbi:ciliogenesis and planar polarity effector 1 isoform 3-T3 [Amazona ochrocephala]